MIANRECPCGRGVVAVGSLVRHAEPHCARYDAAASKSGETMTAYLEACAPLGLTTVAKAAENRLCETAKRKRAGIIGALEACLCGWPTKRVDTTTEHDELCPSHEIILQMRALREQVVDGLAEQLHSLQGEHCPINCACRFVDVALHGGA